jgi:hypothetical protein
LQNVLDALVAALAVAFHLDSFTPPPDTGDFAAGDAL